MAVGAFSSRQKITGRWQEAGFSLVKYHRLFAGAWEEALLKDLPRSLVKGRISRFALRFLCLAADPAGISGSSPMSKKIRYGIIGAGVVAHAMIRAFTKDRDSMAVAAADVNQRV